MNYQNIIEMLIVLKHLAQLDSNAALLTRTDEDAGCTKKEEWFICSKCVLKEGSEKVFNELEAAGANIEDNDRICSFCPFGAFLEDVEKDIGDTVNFIRAWELIE